MAEDQEKGIALTPGKLCACGKPTRKSGKGRYRAQCSTCESKGEEQLREDLVVAGVEKTKLKARIDKLEGDLRERNNENSKLERAIAEMVPTIERLRASLSDRNQLVEDTKAGNARLTKTLEEMTQRRELLDEMLTSAEKHKGEAERLEALLREAQEKTDLLREELQEKIDTLTHEARERDGVNKTLMLKIIEKNGQIQLLSDQARELEGRVETLDKTMASTKILLDSRRLQICRLNDELEEVKAENVALREDLATARASMGAAVLAERTTLEAERAKASVELLRSAKATEEVLARLNRTTEESAKVQAKLRLVSRLSLGHLLLWIVLAVTAFWL
jgi:chromosome segregation ATPase